MIPLKRPLVFIDLETTGINTKEDRIVEIAACKIYENGNTEIKCLVINPSIPIPKGATDVHGIDDEKVKDKPRFSQIAKALLHFIEDCDLGGFNSNSFDFPLLYNEFSRAGYVWDYSKINFIDVGNIYKIMNPRTLSQAYKYYTRKDLSDAHSAEADIKATVEVFIEMMLHHENELPIEMDKLDEFSNFSKKRLDLSGCFVWDKDGDIAFNFGKHKGMKAKKEVGFLTWMAKSNFNEDTIQIVNFLLK